MDLFLLPRKTVAAVVVVIGVLIFRKRSCKMLFNNIPKKTGRERYIKYRKKYRVKAYLGYFKKEEKTMNKKIFLTMTNRTR